MTVIAQLLGINKKILLIAAGSLFLTLAASAVFNAVLAIGLTFVFILSAATFWIFFKTGMKDKEFFQLFLIAFLIHLFASLILYYLIYHASFRLFGGGSDFDLYQNNAIEVANRFKAGNFSLEGLYREHYFSVIIGIIYIFTLAHTLVGQLFTVWLAAISVLLVYLLVIEIGGSKKWAFLIGLIVSVYPSYLYFGSVLLKEILVIPFVLFGILVSFKIYKNFSALKFLAFFTILSAIIHFRFYIGLALMFSFIICWFILSNLKLNDRIVYGLAMFFILGFSPYMLGFGYLGEIPINIYITKKEIKNLREVVYAPISEEFSDSSNFNKIKQLSSPKINSRGELTQPSDFFTEIEKEQNKTLEERNLIEEKFIKGSGVNSSFKEEKFIKGSGVNSSFKLESGVDNPFIFTINYILSFIYALLGPFPWQIKAEGQLISLTETIPWYFFFSFILYNMYHSIKSSGFYQFLNKYKYAFYLVLFSIISIGVISLFINNFGIIVRIRMPVIILLLCVMSLESNFIGNINVLKQKFFKI